MRVGARCGYIVSWLTPSASRQIEYHIVGLYSTQIERQRMADSGLLVAGQDRHLCACDGQTARRRTKTKAVNRNGRPRHCSFLCFSSCCCLLFSRSPSEKVPETARPSAGMRADGFIFIFVLFFFFCLFLFPSLLCLLFLFFSSVSATLASWACLIGSRDSVLRPHHFPIGKMQRNVPFLPLTPSVFPHSIRPSSLHLSFLTPSVLPHSIHPSFLTSPSLHPSVTIPPPLHYSSTADGATDLCTQDLSPPLHTLCTHGRVFVTASCTMQLS